ncbi:MAG: hypothetical protein QOD57_1332 [Actinomycetota bacterium]|jgi:hypothetical protein|nr:hypothetical protein [Actinomycetota bacterium]MDQ1503605.1 hypothetical protein [Actinomycetota bacterium]
MPHETDLIHVMTFCGECSCGCPELFLEPAAPDERRVVLTDDFGQRIQMSLDQWRTIVDTAKSGALDEAVLTRI